MIAYGANELKLFEWGAVSGYDAGLCRDLAGPGVRVRTSLRGSVTRQKPDWSPSG